MSETALEEYRQLVEEQGRALLDVIQSVALGDLDVVVEPPPAGEGVEVLSELAIGVEMMVDDLREVMAEQERIRVELETALAKTEALYEGSDQVAHAATADDVLKALVHSTVLRRLTSSSINLFDRPWGDERPESMTVVAAWERSGEEPLVPIGARYVLDQFPATHWFDREEPRIVPDIATDEHIDENTRALFLEQLGLRGMMIFPLVAGEQWIGILAAQDSAVLDVDETEVRWTASLVGQAATVIQSRRLLEQAQARARRERTLREITARVRGFTDLDAIVRTAVRELGAALGRRAFLRLGSAQDLSRAPAARTGGDDGGDVALPEGGE